MYKTILLYLPSTDCAEPLATAAAKLAKEHDAVLIGVRNTIQVTGIYGNIPEEYLNQHNAREQKEAAGVKAVFQTVANKFGLQHEWRDRPARDVDAYRDIVAQCHAADLVVAPAKAYDDPLGQWFDFPERLTMEAGRPLLLIPRAPAAPTLGKRILVAWNGSRESARAVFDALPLLRAADHVAMLTIAPTLESPLAASVKDITATLVRQGVKAEPALSGDTKAPDGEEILDQVAKRHCDLLVMGFYGHSRLRQLVFGGVTRHVLTSMQVPVFTAH